MSGYATAARAQSGRSSRSKSAAMALKNKPARFTPGGFSLFGSVNSRVSSHLNCGIVGTLMRGGVIGATLLAFPTPLGSVT